MNLFFEDTPLTYIGLPCGDLGFVPKCDMGPHNDINTSTHTHFCFDSKQSYLNLRERRLKEIVSNPPEGLCVAVGCLLRRSFIYYISCVVSLYTQ